MQKMIIFVPMKNLTKWFWAAVLALGCMEVPAQELIQYVNPLVGTAGFGNVYPGAQVPFGGIQKVRTKNWTPQNVHVKAVYLNGVKLKGTTLRYEDIRGGAELLFVMGR